MPRIRPTNAQPIRHLGGPRFRDPADVRIDIHPNTRKPKKRKR